MLESDIAAILARRHDNGADFWASSDRKIYVGNPFSTLSCLGMLHELGVAADHEAAAGGLELVLGASRADGRIRLGPKTPMYPCYSAEAARVLCRFGLTEHASVHRAIDHFIATPHDSGGWRCNFTRFGRGPETLCANPGATLYVLDALRFMAELRVGHGVVDEAARFLLAHWETRSPIGPCHWGIGSSFMRVEYPFLRYNLFFFVYVLSFFDVAKGDARLRSALGSWNRSSATTGKSSSNIGIAPSGISSSAPRVGRRHWPRGGFTRSSGISPSCRTRPLEPNQTGPD